MKYKFLNDNKEKYIEFCEQNTTYVSIFSQPWWLETTSSGDWDVILIFNNNQILAANPYYFTEDCNGNKIIRKAILTQNNGVIFNYIPNSKYSSKISFERKVLSQIIDQIDNMMLKSYRQYFHFYFTNWLPYFWRGYHQSSRYTYVIESNNVDTVRKDYDSKLRNEIKKASSILQIYESFDYEEFYMLNKLTFERQGLDIPYSFDLFKKLYEICCERNACHIFCARDEEKNIHCAVFIVEDKESVYYLMSGTNQVYRNSNALSLLLDYSIEYAIKNGKRFDFEGSMKENIEKHFSQFGAHQIQYMDIWKDFQ